MVMIWQTIGAFVGVFFTAIMVDAPRKYLPISGLIGALGWGLYLVLAPDYGPLFSNYLAGLVIATCAHLVARFMKTPVTVVLIPGFYPLVPGVGMYKTILYLIQGESSLFQANLKITLLTAVMIALSIFTVDSVFNTIFRIWRQVKRRKLFGKP